VKPIRLGLTQYVLVAVTIVVVVPVIVWIVLGPAIGHFYAREVVGPRLQRKFGFEVGLIRVGGDESGPQAWEAIAKVTPGSVLARAGIRRGDTGCLGFDTGGISDIYSALEQFEDMSEVRVSLSNTAQGRKPCRTVSLRR
jgi:hypothetical protein